MDLNRQNLIRAARRLLSTHADAEDAVQDMYLRALTAPPHRREQAPWLQTVLRNIAIDRLRRIQLESRHAAAPLAPGACVESLLELRSECEAALRHLLSRVSPAEAVVILLSDVFEFDHTDIARIVGKNAAASRQFVHRARARARDIVPSSDVDDDQIASLWRAIETRDPALLIGMLQPITAFAQTASHAIPPSAGARTSSRLIHVNGRYAIALVLDGVVLCVVPVGPQAAASLSPVT